MKKFLPLLLRFLRRDIGIAALLLTSVSGVAKATNHEGRPVNKYGAPVLDGKGCPIKYDWKSLKAMARKAGVTRQGQAPNNAAPVVKSRGFLPVAGQTQQPFWQYAIFGSGIGASNIVIGPTPPSGLPEIIIGGNSRNDFGDDDFWQVIRYNPATTGYDTLFVSRLYCLQDDCNLNGGVIRRIGLAHVTDASDQQIVVMLYDGRIYLYDFATKTELGYLDTGIGGLFGLSLTDLDGDGLAELIVTTVDDLFVFNGSGQLLWQVAGAGGFDVVAGQMDNDASLKIAATNGKVVDAVTHAVVWNYTNGFGNILRLAPFPGENYQQLISASQWQYIYSYDVGRQIPQWSISVANDYIGGMDVADVNGGLPEVLVGEGQSGVLHVYDLTTQAELWHVQGYSGVNTIAVGDVDRDGTVELLWSVGYNDTGPDYLYVTNTTGPHNVKWQSVDLQGPFLGPAIGDLDGDGQPELVICSPSSNSGYNSGRMLVFDLATLSLRAMSPPVMDGSSLEPARDLKLRDVEGNGRMEIVIAGDYSTGGAIWIYRFDSNNTFTPVWMNATRPDSPFGFADVADLDNNGMLKVVGGSSSYVYAYEYPSGTQSWQSVSFGNYNYVTGLIVEDLNGDGNKEIAALTNAGDLYTWDGPSRQLLNLRQGTDGTLLSNGATPSGIVLGDTSGVGHFLQWGTNGYTETFTRQLSTQCDPPFASCFNGLNVASDNSLWTGAGMILNQRLAPSYDNVVWAGPQIGVGFGGFVATAVRNDQNCVFSSARQAAVGLTYGPAATPTPTTTPCTGRCSPTPRPSATSAGRPTPPPRLTPPPSPTGSPRPTPAPRP